MWAGNLETWPNPTYHNYLKEIWTPNFTQKKFLAMVCYLPFIQSTFQDGHRFQQDNNPKNESAR